MPPPVAAPLLIELTFRSPRSARSNTPPLVVLVTVRVVPAACDSTIGEVRVPTPVAAFIASVPATSSALPLVADRAGRRAAAVGGQRQVAVSGGVGNRRIDGDAARVVHQREAVLRGGRRQRADYRDRAGVIGGAYRQAAGGGDGIEFVVGQFQRRRRVVGGGRRDAELDRICCVVRLQRHRAAARIDRAGQYHFVGDQRDRRCWSWRWCRRFA